MVQVYVSTALSLPKNPLTMTSSSLLSLCFPSGILARDSKRASGPFSLSGFGLSSQLSKENSGNSGGTGTGTGTPNLTSASSQAQQQQPATPKFSSQPPSMMVMQSGSAPGA